MNRKEKRQKLRQEEESERKRKEELAAKEAQEKEESSDEESSEEEDSGKEDAEMDEEGALVFGLPLPQWQTELKLLVAEELSVVEVAQLTPIEVRAICQVTFGRAKKFCRELEECIEKETSHYELVQKEREGAKGKLEMQVREQAREFRELQSQMEALQKHLEQAPSPRSGMSTPDLHSPGEAGANNKVPLAGAPEQNPATLVDLRTPAELEARRQRAVDQFSSSGESESGLSKEGEGQGSIRKLHLTEVEEQETLSSMERYLQKMVEEKWKRDLGGKEEDVYGDRDTLGKLLPEMSLFEKGVPELRTLKVFESSVSRLVGELPLSKASKEEVAYWLFDTARSLREVHGRLGKIPFILIDYTYVTILFGKQTIPMSVREAQRRGVDDPLAVPRTIYREYCNRLVLSTIFEKLTRGIGCSIREWWARVQMGGLMCDKSLSEQYAKFVSQGGDFVERAAEGVEATFRAKGERFTPSLLTVEVICNQVQNDLARYKKKTARTHAVAAVEEEDDLLREYLESELRNELVWQSETTSFAPVATVAPGRPALSCYNCKREGHLSFRCEQKCRAHPEALSRKECAKCEERFRARTKAKYGADYRAPVPRSASASAPGPSHAATLPAGSKPAGTGVPSASRGGSGGG